MKDWKNKLPFWDIFYMAIAVFFVSFWLVAPYDGPNGIDHDYYHWFHPIHLIGILLLPTSFIALIVSPILGGRQDDRKAKEAENAKIKAEEEEARKKLEATRCPNCKKLNAIQSGKELIDERLVSVRNVPEGNHLWEVEDYEVRYLITHKCCFCEYVDEYTRIERKSYTIKMIH